ncbi:MAG: hypothetical protein JJU25_18930 [Halomonas sp.]|nr:hypothetical protein [Halomonas sp.]MCC5884698.1 hypothetical protein [Halomonas sp.]
MKNTSLKKEGRVIALALLVMFLGLGVSFSGAEKLGYFMGGGGILVANVFGIIAIVKTVSAMRERLGKESHDDVGK